MAKKSSVPPVVEAVAPPAATQASFFEQERGPFFRRVDWIAFFVTLAVAFGIYFYTLAPTVTLEDSGEMAVASDYLGVPHPPGYPIWTLLTWFFQWIFHWVKYFGQPDSNLALVGKSIAHLFGAHGGPAHPNPAWSVGLASAFFGALACALQAMLVSRSAADILSHMKLREGRLTLSAENILCFVGGVTSGLLLAFSPVLWSQSTIVEVYSLNALFMSIILLLIYRWMCRPHESRNLYLAAFLFGLGLTNHQTLVFIGPAVLLAIAVRDLRLFRDCVAALCWVIAAYCFYLVLKKPPEGVVVPPGANQSKLTFGLLLLVAPTGLFLIERKLLTEWKRLLISAALVLLGLSFYVGYMPVASEQNPPMNWGYPRTTEGFWHAVGRGQYEKISPVDNFLDILKNPRQYGTLVRKIVFDHEDYSSVVAQFSWPIALAAILPFLFFHRMGKRSRNWMLVTLMAFVFLTFVFIVFQYLKPDVQTLFIGRVQYIQAHAVFAMWISYGLIFALAYLDALCRSNRIVTVGAAAFILSLSAVPILRNAYDQEFIREVGGCEQNNHDFGWQFGAWQLEGARAILAEIGDEERAAYPNPDYPPPMGTNAVFFGGTDPGRFVPTYMIYSAHYRSDVYLITQNALADNTYMNVMRDLYGDRIWIPSQQDSNYAFQRYVQDVQSGRIAAGAEVSVEGGRVSVQGVQGVMTINGILARMIFEANKAKHPFYVEESYVIPWMYPYLVPHGLIMQISAEPVPTLSAEQVKNDRDFWDWYAKRLLDNPKFRRDVVACKTFSKLRSAIAGLYVARRMYPEAEHAFRQAIALYPLSPEANFRLADVFMQQFRFTEARKLIEEFLVNDSENDRVREFLGQIEGLEKADTRRRELEGLLSQGGDVNMAIELADIYRRMNLMQQFEGITMNIVRQENLPPSAILAVARMYAEMQRFDLLSTALERYVQREPGNPQAWIDLAAVRLALQKTNECFASLRQAVQLGGEPVRELVRKDERFGAVRQSPAFRALIPPSRDRGDGALRFNLPGM